MSNSTSMSMLLLIELVTRLRVNRQSVMESVAAIELTTNRLLDVWMDVKNS